MNDRPRRNVRPATASEWGAVASKRGAAASRHRAVGLLVALFLLGLTLCFEPGCRRPSSPSGAAGPRNPETERAQRRELAQRAIRDGILQYEQDDSMEMLQQREAVSRLDQWVRDQEPLPGWKPDPMVATLPEPLARLAAMLNLDRLEFPRSDAFVLREAAWLRDVANWGRGDAVDELERAKQLFDWTVRNIRLESGAPGQGSQGVVRVLQRPWETLLFGRGAATDQAWVFLLLARQQKIDAALVALIDPDDPTGQQVQPWAVAVLCRGELYLFDPTLGLPIPAPDGVRRGPAGQLDIQPATLAEVAADDALLRQLDIDSEVRYPVESSRLRRVVVLMEASPAYLGQRMKLLESQLVGEEKLVLTADASAQAKGFRSCRYVVDVRLWPTPYQTFVQEMQLGPDRARWQQAQLAPFEIAVGRVPALWKGRQYHLKGTFTGEPGAIFYYQMARLPDARLQSEGLDPSLRQALTLAKLNASYWLGLIVAGQGNHRAAIDWFATRTLKPIQTLIDAVLPPMEQGYGVDRAGLSVLERVDAVRQRTIERMQKTIQRMKELPETSDQHRQCKRDLEDCQRDLQDLFLVVQVFNCARGAEYNLARAYEADGQIAKAIQTYRSDEDSPYRHGKLLRARWLESQAAPESTPQPTPKAADTPEDVPEKQPESP